MLADPVDGVSETVMPCIDVLSTVENDLRRISIEDQTNATFEPK